ncbi:thiopeptide-type bacteriocin biosynthesis domain-containing protein [Micromonospora matsumotoense]|uniref:Thiopeptide-type bacteriocin biosynthesis domain-containing protein n=1 Tax=Micromonospora matsumotoense TaxID=121616 RepID=A0A1C5AU98_9ACTN|nr:thiopeptide-type bacteriocin biosynthesis protein [Micromonospora matsumotoense]SCF48743.1 thiopeptide-type bacteriocin biosynthesis domain-containing protein [Micromonospora matsumotoense]
MTSPQWQQTTITFADPHAAEQLAIAHLAPVLTEAEARQLITTWFYVRKSDWRLRYLPSAGTSDAERYVTSELDRLTRARHIDSAIAGIYEPETHAFGGAEAMDTAHQLWHHDSRHLLTNSPDTAAREPELSIMLCAAMMRAAGLDWYEQGDVWARMADHRDPPKAPTVDSLQAATKRLLTVDPASLIRYEAPLAGCRTLFEAYATAGDALRQLNQGGHLRRGLRATLAHHVIFAWNRRSVPGLRQAAIATAAKNVIFGPDPSTNAPASGGGS